MELQQLQNTFKQLPPQFQEELYHFADYLLSKTKKEDEPNSKSRKSKREFGGIKNLVLFISADFDAPLDEFKEYM